MITSSSFRSPAPHFFLDNGAIINIISPCCRVTVTATGKRQSVSSDTIDRLPFFYLKLKGRTGCMGEIVSAATSPFFFSSKLVTGQFGQTAKSANLAAKQCKRGGVVVTPPGGDSSYHNAALFAFGGPINANIR